jgi:HSP20 family protein
MFNLSPWKKEQAGHLTTREQSPLDRLREDFDALFGKFLGRWPALGSWDERMGSLWDLAVDDTGKEIVVHADAPGFEAGDFDIQVTGNAVTIRAENKHETGDKKGHYSFTQRRLHRTLTLPAGAATDKVDAEYKNGVLYLRFAKNPEAQGKRIEVKG